MANDQQPLRRVESVSEQSSAIAQQLFQGNPGDLTAFLRYMHEIKIRPSEAGSGLRDTRTPSVQMFIEIPWQSIIEDAKKIAGLSYFGGKTDEIVGIVRTKILRELKDATGVDFEHYTTANPTGCNLRKELTTTEFADVMKVLTPAIVNMQQYREAGYVPDVAR